MHNMGPGRDANGGRWCDNFGYESGHGRGATIRRFTVEDEDGTMSKRTQNIKILMIWKGCGWSGE